MLLVDIGLLEGGNAGHTNCFDYSTIVGELDSEDCGEEIIARGLDALSGWHHHVGSMRKSWLVEQHRRGASID